MEENKANTLINYLAGHQKYIKANDLAKEIYVSTKTVYRIIKKINNSFFPDVLIFSERGKGFKINYEKYLSTYHKSEKFDKFSPAERRNRITENLLLSSPAPKKIDELFNDYFIGESVVQTDQQSMAKWLKQFDLELQRKNRTLTIVGQEANIRRAIDTLLKLVEIMDLEEIKNLERTKFDSFDVLFILNQIRNLETCLNLEIPYPYNINIFSHLYILINRLKHGDNINKLGVEDDKGIKKEITDKTNFKMASDTIKNIEVYVKRTIPEDEIVHLYQYLNSCRLQNTAHPVKIKKEILEVTNSYLDILKKKYKELDNISENSIIDLAQHIKPMINRLKNKISIQNVLLLEIKRTYGEIFKDVSSASKKISQLYSLSEIDENENGFLTIYFAKIIEIRIEPVNVLIVCTTGIGTSELLRVKVSKKFPQLKIIKVISTRDLKKDILISSNIDLILTTIELPKFYHDKMLLVSAILNSDDEVRIAKKVEEIGHER